MSTRNECPVCHGELDFPPNISEPKDEPNHCQKCDIEWIWPRLKLVKGGLDAKPKRSALKNRPK